jgi:hypothetical protein
MQACDVGSGQIRYDGVWEPSANQQEFAFAYAQHDFAAKFDQEIAAGFHVTHMQAYDIGGGQIRYDGTWDVGSSGQTRAIGWAFNDFVARWDKEQQLGRRLVMRQAYDIGGGQIRYDGVWEPGTNGQQRSIGFALQPFANKFNEHTSSGGMHMVMMQAYPRVYDLAAPIS